MRFHLFLLAAALAGCGSSSGGNPQTNPDLRATPSDLAMAAPPDMKAATINGCTLATTIDLTGRATATVTFPNGNFTYMPACFKVTAGTQVTFSGTFANHPLRAGNNPPMTDATSPIQATSTGASASFTLAAKGDYGFFCQVHQSIGMQGAVFVQ